MSNDNKKEKLIFNNDSQNSDSYIEVSGSFSMTSEQLDNYIEDKNMNDIEALDEMGFPRKTIKNQINVSYVVKIEHIIIIQLKL